MAVTALTGYLILTHLQACVRDHGCMLDSFTTQTVTNFKPQTLSKSGCSVFTVQQASTTGVFHLSSCARYLQIEDSRVSTVDNPETEVEFLHLANVSVVTKLDGPALADPSQPFCITQAPSRTDKECLALSEDKVLLEYATNTDCSGDNAAWNFISENRRLRHCAGSCPVSVFSGFTVQVIEGPKTDAQDALLFAKASFGLRLKAGSQIEVIGRPHQLGFITINCAATISYLCFETRKVKQVTMLFHDNMGKVLSRKVKPNYPPMYSKSCIRKLPKKEVYRINFKFTLMQNTKAFFFRKLDMGGCHKIF